MADIVLSDKEKKLLEYIKITTTELTIPLKVTVKTIEEDLGKPYIGALGKLLNSGLIEAKKDKQEVDTSINKYGSKLIKHYVIKDNTIGGDGVVINP